MPSKDIKIFEFNQYQKSDKAQSIIYPDLKSLSKKVNGFKNNPEGEYYMKTFCELLIAKRKK